MSFAEKKLLPLLIAVLLFSVHARGEGGGQEPELPLEAERLCSRLFGMLDEGKLRETFTLTGPVVRETENESSWYGQMSSERESMGDVQSRRLTRVEKVDTFADLPRGEYLMAVYETSFSTHPESQEVVVLTAAAGRAYELAGYRVRYDMWPEAMDIIGNGLLIVFFIMSLLATITWLVGKLMQVTSNPEAAEPSEIGGKKKEKG